MRGKYSTSSRSMGNATQVSYDNWLDGLLRIWIIWTMEAIILYTIVHLFIDSYSQPGRDPLA